MKWSRLSNRFDHRPAYNYEFLGAITGPFNFRPPTALSLLIKVATSIATDASLIKRWLKDQSSEDMHSERMRAIFHDLWDLAPAQRLEATHKLLWEEAADVERILVYDTPLHNDSTARL